MKPILLSILSMFILTGCASSLLKPQTSQVPVVTETTNLFPVVTSTNIVTVTNGVSTTNVVTVTNEVAEVHSTTNVVSVTNGYTVSPTVTNALGTAQTVISATAPFNPYAGLMTGILGLAATGLGFYAKIKSDQAATHATAAQTIITAVEGLAEPTASAVKAAVAAKSARMGTSAEVNQVVNAVTTQIKANG